MNSLLAYYSKNLKRLPDGYQEYRFLFKNNSDKSIYIDTGLTLASTMTWELIANLRGTGNTVDCPPIGTGNSKTDSNYALWLHDNGSRVSAEAVFGSGSNSSNVVELSIDTTATHKYKLVLATGQLYIDDTLVGTASSVGGVNNAKKLIISGCWRGSAVQAVFKGRQGETKIYDNGGLVRDYVPCSRLSDEHPGFYELVVGTFHDMTGTNTWISDED